MILGDLGIGLGLRGFSFFLYIEIGWKMTELWALMHCAKSREGRNFGLNLPDFNISMISRYAHVMHNIETTATGQKIVKHGFNRQITPNILIKALISQFFVIGMDFTFKSLLVTPPRGFNIFRCRLWQWFKKY